MACESCGAEYPMRELIDIHERTLCSNCAEQFFSEHSHLSREQHSRPHVDPTICVNCGADNGDMPYELLLQAPICPKCMEFYRNRPFPKWIKASFAAIMVLVVISLAWNWRFFQGYFEIKAAWGASGRGDFKAASEQFAAAARHIPELQDLNNLAALFQGMSCLQENKSEEALACFSKCAGLPPEFGVERLMNYAEAGAAFDRKDYDKFLQIAERTASREPNDPIAQAQVASALACQYAQRGDEELRRRAEQKLDEAKKLGGDALQSNRYEERIRHRLETREIIDGKEFLKRFPDGWKSTGESHQ